MSVSLWKSRDIEDIELDLFLMALKRRYDFDFTQYARASLKRRVHEIRERHHASYLSELLPLVLYDEVFAQQVVDTVTVPMSDFYRDPQVWQEVRRTVIPYLSTFPQITIWEAGCATGEESYSLSILLAEEGLLDRTQIIATDISARCLANARDGHWRDIHLQRWREHYRQAGGRHRFDDYFDREGSELIAKSSIRKNIYFDRHNLAVDDVFVEAQFVICRNVFIYFSEALQNRVSDLFFRSLKRGGHLILGRSELLSESFQDCFETLDLDSRLYRRIGGRSRV